MLEVFITSKTRRKIITVFTKYPDYKAHVRGLAQMIKEDPGNVQRELKKLEEIGFVKATPPSQYQCLHRQSKIYLIPRASEYCFEVTGNEAARRLK